MVSIIKQNYKKNSQIFQNVKKQLNTVLSEKFPITHVGSTAIPKIYGKNIIDILIGAKTNEEFLEITNHLIKLGYFFSEKSRTQEYLFFASTESETKSGDIHIHLVLLNTKRYNDFILLKKYLLKYPEKALDYSNHKKDLVFLEKDRSEYKRKKSEYMVDLIEKARNESYE